MRYFETYLGPVEYYVWLAAIYILIITESKFINYCNTKLVISNIHVCSNI